MVPAPTTTTRFNSPMRVSMNECEQVVLWAIESIPEEFRPYLEHTMFIVDEGDAVGAEMVRHILPPRVDPRRATGEPLRQELLRPRQNADVELARLDDRCSREAFMLEPDEHQRRLGRHRDERACRERAEAFRSARAHHDDARCELSHRVPEVLRHGGDLRIGVRDRGGDVAKW